jgi:hypothetical protein
VLPLTNGFLLNSALVALSVGFLCKEEAFEKLPASSVMRDWVASNSMDALKYLTEYQGMVLANGRFSFAH